MFDPLIHQPIRSKLLSLLISNDELPFKVLKIELDVTDGNLSSHLKKLETAKYINIDKTFEGKRPKTVVHITKQGEKAFASYIDELKKFIEIN